MLQESDLCGEFTPACILGAEFKMFVLHRLIGNPDWTAHKNSNVSKMIRRSEWIAK